MSHRFQFLYCHQADAYFLYQSFFADVAAGELNNLEMFIDLIAETNDTQLRHTATENIICDVFSTNAADHLRHLAFGSQVLF
jgi:hypothetical protein